MKKKVKVFNSLNLILVTILVVELLFVADQGSLTGNQVRQMSVQEAVGDEDLGSDVVSKSGGKINYYSMASILGFCGDGVCNFNETYEKCPSDCVSSPPLELFETVAVYAGEDILTHINQDTLFLGSASSLDGENLKFEWDFGDGTVINSNFPRSSHIYRNAGIYEVKFKATDDFGHFDVKRIKVTVENGVGKQSYLTPYVGVTSSMKSGDGITKYYAIMINGAYEERFWTDVELLYPVLINKYGFSDDTIYLLNYDGNNPSGLNPNNMIDYSASLENVNLVFTTLSGIMDSDDILFVWIDDHGVGYYNNKTRGGRYYGYLDGRATVDPGDEQDYVENTFKLRSLFNGGNYGKGDHGMNEWQVYYRYDYSTQNYFYERMKYVSSFNNLQLQDGTLINDSDVFIEALHDYLLGDTNKDGYVNLSAGEVEDYDADGIPPYTYLTGEFDEDDWGLIDYLKSYSFISTATPGDGHACIFDQGFDNKLDIDINCKCSPWQPELCNFALLDVDGTDLDNKGLFDGIDVNDDGDMSDWVSIDEAIGLYDTLLYDDDLKNLLNNFNVKNVIVFMEPCFSGGFVNDISKSNTLIMAATAENEVSYGNIFVGNFRDILDNFLLGDANKDNRLSMVEAFNYAAEKDIPGEDPQYEDNADKISHTDPIPNGGDGGFGSNLFLGWDYCTDSDKGKSLSVAGTLTMRNLTGTYTYYDSCVTIPKVNLKEYYCNNSQALYTFYNCPNGCLGGACVSSSSSPSCYTNPKTKLRVCN